MTALAIAREWNARRSGRMGIVTNCNGMKYNATRSNAVVDGAIGNTTNTAREPMADKVQNLLTDGSGTYFRTKSRKYEPAIAPNRRRTAAPPESRLLVT